MSNPKDRTEIWVVVLKGDPDMERVRRVVVLYENYPTYDSLPDVAKSDDIKREYEEFWEWKRKPSI